MKIWVNLNKLNVATKKGPYPLPFMDEVINIVVKHEVYTFFDGFSGYHHISITLEDRYKIACVIDWGGFIRFAMAFGGQKWTTNLLEGNHQNFS